MASDNAPGAACRGRARGQWKLRPPRGTPGLRCHRGTGPVRRTEKIQRSPQLAITRWTTRATAPVLPQPAAFGACRAFFTHSTALRIATGVRRRAVGAPRSHPIEFLFLLGGENLAEFLANIGIQFVKLLALFLGQSQTLASKRRKN